MELIASLSKNILKLSLNRKEGFQSARGEISKEAVNDWEIVNVESFAQEFNKVLSQFSNVSKKSLEMVYLIEPGEVILKFVTVGKNESLSDDEQVLKDIREKLDGVSLEDLYFSYQKIAPFVYQFVGIKKVYLERYVELGNALGISLKAAVPWVLAVPKFLENNDPFVFILMNDERHTIALAELNGIYYSENFEHKQSPQEITDLVQKLSVYKRSDPINKIYTLVINGFDFGEEYKVTPIMEIGSDFSEAEGFELHVLVAEVLGSSPDYGRTQFNLLNLFPVPVIREDKPVAVYAGAAMVAFLLLAGLGAYYLLSNDSTGGELAQNIEENTAVLSEVDDSQQSTESESALLSKEDVNVRVENGAGIPGIAGQTQETLEELGYTVVSIGNADETGRGDTLVRFKDSKSDYQPFFEEDLQSEFELVFEGGLSEDLEYDFLIIVGLN
jgi:hypothetical protein